MRVIGGRFRSRKLKSIPGMAVRPTPDRLREALFNVLAPQIEGARFLDTYAGTGAVGIEALSRGAKHVVLIERNRAALAAIHENLASLGIGKEEITVVRGSAATLLKEYPADIAFVDPPYDDLKQYDQSIAVLSTTGCRLVIAQHTSRVALQEQYGTLTKVRILRQGDNSLSFYQGSGE